MTAGTHQEVALDEIKDLADDLAAWLSRKDGVSSVQPPVLPGKPSPRSRFPFRRSAPAAPAFEIRFVFRGQARRFRYIIENRDDLATMKTTLRVHTNGELLVRVPDRANQVMANDIYYGSRSIVAAPLGEVSSGH